MAMALGDDHISSYHFLLAVERHENSCATIFHSNNLSFNALYEALKKDIPTDLGNYYLTKELENTYLCSAYYAWVYRSRDIGIEHFILAMLTNKKSLAGQYLSNQLITYQSFKIECEKNNVWHAKILFEKLGQNSLFVLLRIPKLMSRMIRRYYL